MKTPIWRGEVQPPTANELHDVSQWSTQHVLWIQKRSFSFLIRNDEMRRNLQVQMTLFESPASIFNIGRRISVFHFLNRKR
jgi:hypothetical protein